MTPQEKAIEIVSKFEETIYGYDVFDEDWIKCINCALIAVDEIIKSSPFYPHAKYVGGNAQGLYENVMFPINYWQEVKQEIENL